MTSESVYGDSFLAIIRGDNRYDDLSRHSEDMDGDKLITRGNLPLMHDVFNEAVERGVKPMDDRIMGDKVNRLRKRIMDGLDRDERFEKSYIKYAPVHGGVCRCFRLKEEFVVSGCGGGDDS